jgi:hypothetical protein
MGLRIEAYSAAFAPAVASFNARLSAQGVPSGYLIGDAPAPPADVSAPERAICKRQFLAVEDGHVRGGFMLQRQPFWVDSALRDVGNYQMPISEGIIDRKYAHVALLMLTHALRTCPLLFAVGGGGALDQPQLRMLEAMGWTVRKVPFLFHVCHPRRFLAEIRPLRRTPLLRLAAEVARATGIGSAGIRFLQARAAWGGRTDEAAQMERVESWCGWADELWEATTTHHSLAGVRTGATLSLLYPADDPRYLSYRVRRDGRVVGWAVLLDTRMRGHKQFGDLRVGTVLDCLALPGDTEAVAGSATRQLQEAGVDLIVTNQAHADWVNAFRRAGYLSGPSNYPLSTSRQLTALLAPPEEKEQRVHVTRGDGDGRIHL